jgi:pantothenate synthetase
VGLVRTNVSEERVATIFGVERIRKTETLAISSRQEPHGATSQNTAFFIVTAVKTSNVT